MKSLSNTVVEKLEINKEYQLTWAARKKAKHVESLAQIKKFKQFFEELKECSGLGISIIKREDGRFCWLYLDLYYIRETEQDKYIQVYKKPKTYKCILKTLFGEEDLDIHRPADIDSDVCIVLVNIEDDIDMLKNLGFTKITHNNLNSDRVKFDHDTNFTDLYKDLSTNIGMCISIKDLYNNIDKIYKAFFE